MKRLSLFVVLLLVAAGCGSDHSEHTGGSSSDSEESVTHDDGSIPGEPADASEADRQVTVVASDQLRFDPETIDVAPGQAITFTVRNEGQTDHEFVLGDSAYQEQHEQDMAEGGHHMDEVENAVSVGPGERAEITWRFDEEGEVLYGCHEPGHYEGGMVGSIEVQ
jgi:uncharacterized cupredoxin-like copper-binding protein